MKMLIIYAVALVVLLEVLREYRLYKLKKRIEKRGEMSKWDIERYIDFKKLIVLIIIGVGIYFSLPLIKKYMVPNIKDLSWLFNRQLFFVFLRIIGICVVVEIVYKFILMKLFCQMSSLWNRLLRYVYWSILIYLVVALWPFGKLIVSKFKESVSHPYVSEMEDGSEDVSNIRNLRENIKTIQDTLEERETEINKY